MTHPDQPAPHPALVPFLLRHAGRYWHWAAASVLTIAVFGVASAAMLGLIHPIFNDVLKFDQPLSLAGQLPGGSAGATAVPTERRGPLGSAARLTARARAAADSWYRSIARAMVREGGPITTVVFSPLLFVLVFLVRALASFVSAYAFQRIGLSVTTDLRNGLYRRFLDQSSRFHTEHPSGELFSRVVSDVGNREQVVSTRLLDLLQQPVALVVYLAVLLSIHLPLAMLVLVAAPGFSYPIARFGSSMRRTSRRTQERMADLSALLIEVILGNRVVKAFGMEEFESARFEAATRRHLRVNLRAQVLNTASSPVVESLAAIGCCGLVVYVGSMIRAGLLTPALFIQFLTTMIMLYDPLRKLNKVNLAIQDMVAAVRRIADVMAIPNEIADQPSHPPLTVVRDGVRYQGVSFSYGNKLVLDDFELTLRAGEVVALVGPSGAGKSTVVNLLPRFIEPLGGQVTLDGVDIRRLPLANLRSLIGLVTQETVLFNDTVRNNIAYGRADLPLERVREAAAAAYADDFIMELEGGYQSVIGESGHQLSGGQRQRLAIARALLKNAPVLILDEATSHLDTESEALVQRALTNLMRGRTALVIAHRLSTVMSADRIVVLESGKIAESGSHDELLRRGGTYKRLYDLQFKDT